MDDVRRYITNDLAIEHLLRAAETRASLPNRWPTKENVIAEIVKMVREHLAYTLKA